MNLRRARVGRVIYAVVAVVTLAGASSVIVGGSSTAMASASARSAHLTAAPQFPIVPDNGYGTLKNCNSEGDYLFLHENIATWKCVEVTEASYVVWDLYFKIFVPGSPWYYYIGVEWYYYSNYPSSSACDGGGLVLALHDYAIGNYKCVEVTEASYVVWDLYFALGHYPGS
jgi:hypothetical protein